MKHKNCPHGDRYLEPMGESYGCAVCEATAARLGRVEARFERLLAAYGPPNAMKSYSTIWCIAEEAEAFLEGKHEGD